MKDKIISIAIFLLIWCTSFIVTAGLIYVICWAFKLPWSWRISLGVWVVIIILNSIFKQGEK